MSKFKSYMEAKERLQSIVNDIPLMWAYNDQQFQECARKCGYEDTNEFIAVCCKGPAGSFLLKSDMEKVKAAYAQMDAINAEVEADDTLLYEMLRYEMGNHECQISRDYDDVLDLIADEIKSTARFKKIFAKAKHDFIAWCDVHDYYG